MLPEQWMLDYETLRIIWWGLLGILLIGFAIMDGFDLGVGMLLPIISKSDIEKRIMINSVGPVWEGNQVWFILGGGAIFAAWPFVYAIAFSGFYIAMFVVLCALILRPVGFEFRHKIDSKRWTSIWDKCLFIGGFVPSLIFGVAIGNLFLGVPFTLDETLRMTYSGTFFDLLAHPFAYICGLVSVFMLMLHGATYLMIKTEKCIFQRARIIALITAVCTLSLFTYGGYALQNIPGHIISSIQTDGPSNPLLKTVEAVNGGWLLNYEKYEFFIIAPVLAYLGGFIALLSTAFKKAGIAFLGSALCVSGIILTAGVSLFPFYIPSSIDPSHSLTVWDSSSSHNTLFIMLIAVIIFLPIVLSYVGWVYNILRGKVTESYIKENSKDLY